MNTTERMSSADLDHYAALTDAQLRELAIEVRNEILDELERREAAMEARAEERRNGGYLIPANLTRAARRQGVEL